MTAPLTLKTVIGNHPHTRPLKDGSITSPRVCLEHVEVGPANRAFRPMVNDLAYVNAAAGLEPNRGALTLLARYAYEQHVTPHTLTAEELYSTT
jgi:hypothetical protein